MKNLVSVFIAHEQSLNEQFNFYNSNYNIRILLIKHCGEGEIFKLGGEESKISFYFFLILQRDNL